MLTSHLRVGTLNVNNRTQNCQRFVDIIVEHKLDIIGLNECGHLMMQEMEKRLKSHGYLHSSFAAAAYAGNCLFSRVPLNRKIGTTLRTSTHAEARSAIFCSIDMNMVAETEEGVRNQGPEVGRVQEVWLALTHLSHVHEIDRVEQFEGLMEELASVAGTVPAAPVCVLMGDLNALSRRDYSDIQWKHIQTTRAK
jgi:endonuclease/exonuclease/phosphatase family metal-dependent hydrolase